MHLVAAGLSFRSAPLSVRERAVVAGGDADRLLRYLVGHCGLRGAAVLSTCNRTEFYVSCPTTALADEVCPRLAMYLDPDGDGEVGRHLFELRDAEAIRHILRVAAGLESMVVGEPQVLGQFKAAHAAARETGTLDARLDYVMRRAVSAGKRVRAETGLGRGARGLAEAAVEIATEVGAGLQQSTVLLVGAGTMSSLAGSRLAGSGARLLVASRTGETAEQLATELGPAARAVADPLAAAVQADVVICSTDSAEPVFGAEAVAAIQEQRRHRPLLMIDVAVPRDIDPRAARVAGVTLIDVDAVGQRIGGGGAALRSAVADATAIIEAEVRHAIALVTERDTAGPTIGALVRRAESVRRHEVERTLARMPADSATVERIQQLTRSIVSKLLHAPISHLREFSEDPAVALTLRDAFDLDSPEHADAAGPAEDSGADAAAS